MTSQVWPFAGLVEWATSTRPELGPCEAVRATPWSVVVRWRTDGRWVWGKAVCPGFAAECALLPLLAEREPELVLAPIDSEPRQGWMLLPDGGPTLGGDVDIATWESVLRGYARLQRSLEGDVSALLDAGCPDMRPRQAVDRLEQMMEQGQVPAHRELLDSVRAIASRIDMSIAPATIQHDDLRPDNVFADGRVFDWGDASVAHPFASMLTALMPNRASRPGTHEEKLAMRDAYLSCWLDNEDATSPSLDVLRAQADLAVLLAPIGRIDTWLRAPAGALEMYPDAIDRWVEQLHTTCLQLP